MTGLAVDGRIRLSQDSGTPIYIQLADQLKYLIGTGEFAPGTRLPAARHLAANLQVNRNTVLNAYALLGEEGYVKARRGGGTVVASRPASDMTESRFSPELLSIVEQLVDRATGIGLTPEDMGSLVAAHARIKHSVSSLRVCFVECNPHSLDHYVGQIRREFDVAMVPVFCAISTLWPNMVTSHTWTASSRPSSTCQRCVGSCSIAMSRRSYWPSPSDRT